VPSRAQDELKARGLRSRLWLYLLAPIPRRWSSALFLCAAAIAVAILAPASHNRFAFHSTRFSVTLSGGRVLFSQAGVDTGDPAEVWSVTIEGTSSTILGWRRYRLDASASRITQGGPPLAPPSAEELQPILYEWGRRHTDRSPAEPFAQMARNGLSSRSEWIWREFWAAVFNWLAAILFFSGLFLGAMRMHYRREYERAIARWYDGKCPGCAYTLEGLKNGPDRARCPECGLDAAAHIRFVDGILRGR
jgi:hypothetical protein